MTEQPPTKPKRSPYKIRGEKTWLAALTMYQQGASARLVAETFDVSEANIRRRAANGGWRKRDLPDTPAPVPEWSTVAIAGGSVDPTVDGDGGAADVRAAARAGFDQAVSLLAKGQFTRAAEAAKAAEMIGRLAERLPDPAIVDAANDAAVMDDLRRRILAMGPMLKQAGMPVSPEDER